MKRASLSTVPARPKAEPADLTDRLLAREALPVAESPRVEQAPLVAAPPPADVPAAAPAPKPKPARRQRARAAKAAEPPTAPAGQPEATPAPAKTDLARALRQAHEAAEALRAAGREAPARYDLAVRYRLDALAHHLRQVAEFLAGRMG